MTSNDEYLERVEENLRAFRREHNLTIIPKQRLEMIRKKNSPSFALMTSKKKEALLEGLKNRTLDYWMQ